MARASPEPHHWRTDPTGDWRRMKVEATAQAELRTRLSWAHGEDRAFRIIAGADPATEADILAWRSLGQ